MTTTAADSISIRGKARKAPRRDDQAFRTEFGALFKAESPRVFRFLDRYTGEPETAADLTQEAFLRLFKRGSMPDSPRAWLITVALNLLRNLSATRTRRRKLLSVERGRETLSDPAPPPDARTDGEGVRHRVRNAMSGMSERDRSLLLLRAEGMSYREMAEALDLNEASVGTLLARAKRAFREGYEGDSSAS